MKRILGHRPICVVLLFVTSAAGSMVAPEARGEPRDHPLVRRAFRSVVQDARQSTVRVLGDGEQVALGAVVDADGWVVTKASQLKGKISCERADGERFAARVITTDDDLDLALLRLDRAQRGALSPLRWRETGGPSVASWLATPGTGAYPLAVGVVSVAPREIEPRQGFLGVGLDQVEQGIHVNEVLADSAAEKAGLKVNDVVTHINGRPVRDRIAMVGLIRSMRPGETVRLRLKRDEESLELTARLGTPELSGMRADRFERMNALGGELSMRRAGFSSALQHDTVLRPNQCGGQIVDLDGKAVGINIARAGRTNSYAIPAVEVRQLVAKWRQEGTLTSPVAKAVQPAAKSSP